MAVYFNLGLFTRDRDSVLACAEYFRGQELVFAGTRVVLDVFEPSEVPGGWLLGVWPHGMSYGSPHGNERRLTEDDARAEIAATFDTWLAAAPPFTLAFFGAEAFDYLLDGIGDIDGPFDALVFDETLYAAFGRPDVTKLGATRYWMPRRRPP